MSEPAWEFCQVMVLRGKRSRCDLTVYYLGRGGGFHKLADLNGREWPFDPWATAMARLGAAGWELVAVQHAASLVHPAMGYGRGAAGVLSEESIVAYFKRPMVDGRKVDEPKLVL